MFAQAHLVVPAVQDVAVELTVRQQRSTGGILLRVLSPGGPTGGLGCWCVAFWLLSEVLLSPEPPEVADDVDILSWPKDENSSQSWGGGELRWVM